MGGLLFTIAVLVVVLGVLVFIHELGHYWAAKAFGVWVHRFAVGIGAPIKRLSFRRGETEWAIAWLPLGGYVKMASREEDPAAGVLEGGAENAVVPPDRVFEAKPIWQRMVIILAGVALNLVFAWLVYTGLALANGKQDDPTTRFGGLTRAEVPAVAAPIADVPIGTPITAVDGVPVATWGDIMFGIARGRGNEVVITFEGHPELRIPLHRDQLVERSRLAEAMRPAHAPVVGRVVSGSRAGEAGIEPGDSLVAVDGAPIRYWPEAVERIEAAPGREVAITVMRDGTPTTVRVTPEPTSLDPDDSTAVVVGRIGVVPDLPVVSERYSLGGAIAAGTRATWGAAGMIVSTVRGLLTRRIDSSEVGGPILIAQLAAESARVGLATLLAFMALISVNLAVVNLLPIPVLDGGAFLILAIEGIIRRPLPLRLREAIQMLGLVMIVALMVLAFSNDIRRVLGL
jgi:regulator of sigma E protease